MKIVHFAKFFPPEYGGIESVTQALAEDHAAAGYNVDVICFTRNATQFEQIGRLGLRRVKVRREIGSQPVAFSYLGACGAAARDADVVHVHAPNMLAALAVVLLPRRIRVVVHWHADIQNKGAIGRLVRPLERAMLLRADIVIATTQAYAEASTALAAFRDRIKVIPIGIADLKAEQKFEIGTTPYVLSIGRLVPYKGLNVLLDAVPMVRSKVEFRIVGTGPQLAALEAQSSRLGITDKVKFMGQVGQTELQRLIAGTAVFCLPSVNRLEAFGVVLLEAMRAGRPIITTNIRGSGVPWVNLTGVKIPVNDPKALAEAIDRLVTAPEECTRLGKLARSRFLTHFSRKAMSDEFLSVYQGLKKKDRGVK